MPLKMLFLRQLLEEFSRSSSFSVDQVNYAFCMFSSLPLGYVYKTLFHPKKVSTITRQLIGFVWGFALGWFCFQWQVFILVADVTVCYWLMNIVDPRYVHRYVFLVSMLVMTTAHLHRQITDYGSYRLDYTGPLMLITQKLTYVAFNLHDGLARKDEELNSEQRNEKLKEVPSLLQYYSYTFHYSMLLAGPVCTFREYRDFIDGSDVNLKIEDKQDPSPLKAVCVKVITSLVCLIGVYLAGGHFVIAKNGDPEFISNHILAYRIFYAWCCTFFTRLRYYFAFLLADAVGNASGLGFNGYDNKGEPRWDRLSNVHILNIEVPLNIKLILDNWNITTALWLRRIVYDRVRSHGLVAVFVLSAIWHGFYPGYYLAFLTAGLMVQASRMVRRSIRSYFQESRNKALLYDMLTCAVSIFCLTYATVPFIALELRVGLAFWRSTYFFGHICCILGFVLPHLIKRLPTSKDKVANHNAAILSNGKHIATIDDLKPNKKE